MTADPQDDRALTRAAVAASGLSQVQFAHALGVDPRTVRRWLAGDRVPSATARALLRQQVAAGPVAESSALDRLRRAVSGG